MRLRWGDSAPRDSHACSGERAHSHTLPEWQDPQGSGIPIRIRDILAAEGFDETGIQEIEDTLAAEAFAESIEL